MTKMKKMVLVLCASAGLAGCGDLEVPDLNRPSLESFENNPTRAGVNSAATGLLIGHRVGVANQNGYVSMLGVLGRESYVLDKADPRYISEMLAGTGLDPGSPAFGGNFWVNPYLNIRNANTILNVLDKVGDLTPEEKNAISGFTKTIQALDFLVVINTRDTNGAPIDVNHPLGSPLAPIESKEAVLAHIARLLDEAKVELAAGGKDFPFALSTGFIDFDDPEQEQQLTVRNFLKVNRALKARVDVYREDWNAALTDLSESFLTTTPGKLDLGVYHSFSGGSGDVQNGLYDSDKNPTPLYAHNSIVQDADKQTDDPLTADVNESTQLDARVLRKVRPVKEFSWQDVSSTHKFTLYTSFSAKVAIIRNEELLLLRAEANLRLGNDAAAMEDLNRVRVQSGKLAPVPEVLTGGNIINELLEQRRYSLLFEGGHRWIDMRRYNKLNELPLDAAGHRVHERFPIPTSETDARE